MRAARAMPPPHSSSVVQADAWLLARTRVNAFALLGGPPARSPVASLARSAAPPSSDFAAAAWRWRASLRAPPGGAGLIGGDGGGTGEVGGATLRPTGLASRLRPDGGVDAGGGGGGGGAGGLTGVADGVGRAG